MNKHAEPGLLELMGMDAPRASAPVNTAQVRHLSPFRYPGGKTWLVPALRERLRSLTSKPALFVEPFAGGAICAMTAAAEYPGLKVAISEIDPEVAAVWHIVFNSNDAAIAELCRLIATFEISRERAIEVIESSPDTQVDKAFRTIVRNRVNSGGVLARGASILKHGENGKGVSSRWYPATLISRLRALRLLKPKVSFREEDAFETIDRYTDDESAFFLIDPPYTAGGKGAGARLYNHCTIDHGRLFDAMERVKGDYILTYDISDEVQALAEAHGMKIEPISMKNRHHKVMSEALISRVGARCESKTPLSIPRVA